jgi:CelD/BcsL family acetyltransferase involved in cellulose biosynthesis
VQISVTRPGELGPGEIAAWHSMQRKTRSLANPFMCPEFAVAVGRVRPDARVAVLTDGSDIAGFFPFQRRRFGVGVPIGAGLTDCQGLIYAPDVGWDARELLRACNLSVWQFDCLAEGQRPFEHYGTAVAPSPVIDLSDGFAAYQEKLQTKSPRFCKDLARKARKLEREAGELRFEVDSRDPAHLRALMRWKSGQYRRTGWIDSFDRLWVVDLIDDLFSTHTDQFDGLLSVLCAGGTPVAMHFGLRAGPMLAHCYPVYDPDFSKHSPGLIHHLQMADETAALGVHLIDMGKGPERYKQTLKSHDLFVAEGAVTRGAVVAAAHRVRTSAVRWAGPRIRKHPRLFHAADRVLRQFGRTTLARPLTALSALTRSSPPQRCAADRAASLLLYPV